MADALRTNTTLVHLSLDNTGSGDAAAAALAQVLVLNTTLTSLNLAHCLLSDAGGQSLAGALKPNNTLLRLDLSANALGEGGVVAIGQVLRHWPFPEDLVILGVSFSLYWAALGLPAEEEAEAQILKSSLCYGFSIVHVLGR